jgi:hypothetical protein
MTRDVRFKQGERRIFTIIVDTRNPNRGRDPQVGQAPVQGSKPGRQARANRQICTKGNTLGAVAKRDVSALLA